MGVMPPGCPAEVRWHFPGGRRLLSWIGLAALADAKSLPSGLKATAVTQAVCARKLRTSWRCCTVHSLMVLSALADANNLPSALKVTAVTGAVWPFRV